MTENGPDSIVANWSAPASPNGIILNYNANLYERQTDANFQLISSTTVLAEQDVERYFTVFRGLSAFMQYRVVVAAETRVGEGESVDVFVTTDPDSSSPPTNFAVVTVNSTSIEVSWGYPSIPRGNITGYTIFTDAVESGHWNVTLDPVNDMSDQVHVFGGLDPFTDYRFRVEAFAVTPEQTHFGQTTAQIIGRTAEDSKRFFANLLSVILC